MWLLINCCGAKQGILFIPQVKYDKIYLVICLNRKGQHNVPAL